MVTALVVLGRDEAWPRTRPPWPRPSGASTPTCSRCASTTTTCAALLRAQGALLRHNGRYLWLSLLPLVVTAVPLTLVIAQVQAWYGYSGLAPDVPVLVSADLTPGVEPTGPRLEGDGVRVDGEAMYLPSLRQLVWRVVPTASGAHQVVVQVNGVRYEKSLVVSTGLTRRSPVRPPAALFDQLLEPRRRR